MLDTSHPCGYLAIKSTKAKSKGKNQPASEKIYRRRDVKLVRSARGWYQLGRVIKVAQAPLKHVIRKKMPTTGNRKNVDETDDLWGEPIEIDDGLRDGEVLTGLYSLDQTEIYVPPPIIDGKVQRNAYGNIDVYVPSMIPEGGVLLRYPHIAVAARMAGIDYANAVTGFDFGGSGSSGRKKQGRGTATARIDGIVIAKEYEEAVRAIYEHLAEEQEQEDREIAIMDALMGWRRCIIALRIKARLEKQHGKVEDLDAEVMPVHPDEHEEGGFIPDDRIDVRLDAPDQNELGGGFEQSGSDFVNEENGGGFFNEDETETVTHKHDYNHDEEAREFLNDGDGGFIPEDEQGGGFFSDEGGAFLPDDDQGNGFIQEGGFSGGHNDDGLEVGLLPGDVIKISEDEPDTIENCPKTGNDLQQEISPEKKPEESEPIAIFSDQEQVTYSSNSVEIILKEPALDAEKGRSSAAGPSAAGPSPPVSRPLPRRGLAIPMNIELLVVPSAKAKDSLADRIVPSSKSRPALLPNPVASQRIEEPQSSDQELGDVPAHERKEEMPSIEAKGQEKQKKQIASGSVKEEVEEDEGDFFPDSMSESELYQEYDEEDDE